MMYTEPLLKLTPTSESPSFIWDESCTKAFNKLKQLLPNELRLDIFDPNLPTIFATDASNIGLGAT